jgi:HAD superfamily hydrolase (TIGR01509 family)
MSARPPLEAIVFDAGGTLVRLDFEWMAATVTQLGFALDAATLRRAEVAGRRAYDASSGHPPGPGEVAPPLGSRGSTEAYFTGMLAACGEPGAVADSALDAFLERQRDHGLWMKPAEGARSMLDALAALRLRLACVSNSDGRAEETLAACGVRDGLEFVVDSHVVGVEKPDPRIFAIALERLGVAPDRALYVGDILSVDREGSQDAGMHFTLIDPYGDYAPPGVAAIASIGELPAHLQHRFELVPSGNAAGTPASHRAVP